MFDRFPYNPKPSTPLSPHLSSPPQAVESGLSSGVLSPFPLSVSGLPSPTPANASLVYISELLTLDPLPWLLAWTFDTPVCLDRSRSEPEEAVLSTILAKFHPEELSFDADVEELESGGLDHPPGLRTECAIVFRLH